MGSKPMLNSLGTTQSFNVQEDQVAGRELDSKHRHVRSRRPVRRVDTPEFRAMMNPISSLSFLGACRSRGTRPGGGIRSDLRICRPLWSGDIMSDRPGDTFVKSPDGWNWAQTAPCSPTS